MTRVKWSKEEVIVAYALYCITPLNKLNTSNLVIQQVSDLINPSLQSLVMRMRNFIALDENNKSKGLKNIAKIDREIYEEFKTDWKSLASFAEDFIGLSIFNTSPINGSKILSSLTDRYKVNKERQFFRASVFATYEGACTISGLTIPSLLTASHIKPYSACKNSNERTTPENGILLNAFYDKAFDKGLFTICPNFKIYITKELKHIDDSCVQNWLAILPSTSVFVPKRFCPRQEFLEYHNDMVFRG